MSDSPDPSPPRRGLVPKLAILVLVVAALVAAFRFLPIADFLNAAIAWVESLGFWAPVAFIAVYAIAAVLLLSGLVFTLSAGALFGVVWGSIYVSIASTLGATLAFLIGRHLARRWVEGKIAGDPRFASIDAAVAKEGWKIVGLTRLSPLFPFVFLNYAYGITKVRLRDYVLASWIGMMPATVLYVYLGSLGKAAAEAGSKSPGEWAIYGIGFLATILVTVYVTKIARRALSERIEKA